MHEATEEGTSVLELVVVEDRVLRSGAPEPGRARRLDEHATAAENGDLPGRVGVEIVVCNPEPSVLEVDALGALGCVEHEEDALTLGLGVVGLRSRAVDRVELSTKRSSNADVRVPHARLALVGSHVPFNHDGTTVGTLTLEDDVADLDGSTGLVRLANLEDRSGLLGIAETGGDEERPNFTNNLNDLGHLDGLADDVSTVVEVSDLAFFDAVEEVLNTRGVISDTITLAAKRLGRLELRCRNILVLRLGATEDLAGGVKE